MDNSQKNLNNIEKLYENLTYFDEYSSQVIIFIILTILLFLVVSYSFISVNIQPIKDDWVNQRCKPYIIPFAGLINKPDNMTVNEFTEQNFNYCAQNILKGITGSSLQPLTFVTNMLSLIITQIRDALQAVREFFYKLRSMFISITKEIMGRLMNIMIPLQQIIISFRDMIAKVQGVMTAGLFTLLGSFYTLQAMMGAIAQFVIIILIAMAVMIALFWIIPFTWPMATSLTAVFIALSIPMVLILAFMLDVLKVKPDLSIPSIKCFDKNTTIKMNDGTYKQIIDVQIGDILFNNDAVTSKIKVTTEGSQMYMINDIIVSDSHYIMYKDKWITVSQHPDSVKIDNYSEPYLYCLNTESKLININDCVFSDWDELFEDDIEMIALVHRTNKFNTNFERTKEFSRSDIHRFFDGGFKCDTKIKLLNGDEKCIMDIKINDILYNGEKVYGLIEIDGNNLNDQYIYDLGIVNNVIYGGPNLNLCDRKIKFTSTLNMNKNSQTAIKDNKLYHLLTNKKSFHVGKIRFYDYNASIDLLLDKNRGKLLSMKYV